MEAHQTRVVEEKRELDEKLNALINFFPSDIFNNLPAAEKERLILQKGYMTSYSDVLAERIANFN